MNTIFFQNYHDEMALRIHTGNDVTYFQVLKKGNVISEMIKPYRLMNVYEIKPKHVRSLGTEIVKFKLKSKVEENALYPDKYLIVEIYKDYIVHITDESKEWIKIIQKASECL